MKFSLINFWSHVLISSTESVLDLSVSYTRTKVCKLGSEVFGDENILGLNISVNEFFGVQIVKGLNYLIVKLDELPFIELRHFFDESEKISVFCELDEHDEIIVSHIEFQKVDHVLVIETLVNFDFS